jgi:hypothetical protein
MSIIGSVFGMEPTIPTFLTYIKEVVILESAPFRYMSHT